MLSTLIHTFFLVVFAYCFLSVLYLFLLSLWGKLFYKQPTTAEFAQNNAKKIAVLVPAYREDGIILSTAQNLLSLDYPSHLYQVFIIADSFQPSTISELKQLPITVLEVSFDKSTKTKSLNEAFSRIEGAFDIALICDADNMLAKDFLKKINHAFVQGARAVQGRRVAKNLDTSFAILDACSEAINNHIFRKGTNAIGLSSAVIGSGMAFEYDMIRDILGGIDAVGGFDKPLQLKVVQQGVSIRYLDNALVFDEKVDSSQAFQNQRKRWVSSQFIYLKRYFVPALRQLFKGNFSYFNLAIANNLVLPRAFMLVLPPVLAVWALLMGSNTWALASAGLWLAYMLTLAIALPTVMVNRSLLQAVLRLPKAIFMMFGTLFQIKKANKTFIHTVHTKTEVSNTLFKDHGR
jgi:cellulose synthase/poly-beta-1,6-N-acetylglucosamine synthase-like glycosyltransferase